MIYHILESGQRVLAIKNFPLDIDLRQWVEQRRQSFALLGIKGIECEDVVL